MVMDVMEHSVSAGMSTKDLDNKHKTNYKEKGKAIIFYIYSGFLRALCLDK
jgi:hypothetical protein